jgi:hypothetical protein
VLQTSAVNRSRCLHARSLGFFAGVTQKVHLTATPCTTVTDHCCAACGLRRLDTLGGPESVAGLVDLLVFASASRGASEEEVGFVVCCMQARVGLRLHNAGYGRNMQRSSQRYCVRIILTDLICAMRHAGHACAVLHRAMLS